jgi:putative selenium metabolism protein SsnA
MNRVLIQGGIVVTFENPNRVLADHAVLIEDDTIRGILPRKAARDIKAEVLDARDKVVMPGFVNAHTHFYSSFARGLTKAAPSGHFLSVLRNLWWRLDRRLTLEDCYFSTLVTGLEAIRHGTTTIIDHHSSPSAVRGSLARTARAVGELGLRACLCYEVSDRNGREAAQQGVEENIRFLEECRRHQDAHISALFGMHASFTLGERTLRRCAEEGRKRGAGFHIHCAEDLCDQRITRSRFGRSVVRRLADHGILGPRTICAHAVHMHDSEWDLLAQTKTAVVHNPQSNMNNAVGIMDLEKAIKKGVLVGLGTDAMTCDMLEELRSAIWVQKLRQRNPGAAFHDAVALLIRNNREIAGRYFPKVGQLKEGWKADLVCIDYLPPTGMNEENFAGHLVFGLSQAVVDSTMVGGKFLMKNKRFTCLDEEKITHRARKLSAALWNRF